MRLRGSSSSIRSGAGTLVVLAAAALGSPSGASAGCSRDAVSGTSHTSILALLDRVPPAIPVAPRAPAKPCDGPSCSGRPAAPATSPVAPRPLRSELWGCLAASVAAEGSPARHVPPAEASACATDHGLRVERPPRLLSYRCG